MGRTNWKNTAIEVFEISDALALVGIHPNGCVQLREELITRHSTQPVKVDTSEMPFAESLALGQHIQELAAQDKIWQVGYIHLRREPYVILGFAQTQESRVCLPSMCYNPVLGDVILTRNQPYLQRVLRINDTLVTSLIESRDYAGMAVSYLRSHIEDVVCRNFRSNHATVPDYNPYHYLVSTEACFYRSKLELKFSYERVSVVMADAQRAMILRAPGMPYERVWLNDLFSNESAAEWEVSRRIILTRVGALWSEFSKVCSGTSAESSF